MPKMSFPLDSNAHAMATFDALLGAIGDGAHHIALLSFLDGGPCLSAMTIELEGEDIEHRYGDRPRDFYRLFEIALSADGPSGIAMRTLHDQGDRCRVWLIRFGVLEPMSAAECFNAYCTDPADGSPVPPQHGVSYEAAPEIRV
ncbi:hypothetical protein [Streptomyces sp. NPDC001054]